MWQPLTLVQGCVLRNSRDVHTLSFGNPAQFLSQVRIGTAASSTPFDLVVWLGWPGPLCFASGCIVSIVVVTELGFSGQADRPEDLGFWLLCFQVLQRLQPSLRVAFQSCLSVRHVYVCTYMKTFSSACSLAASFSFFSAPTLALSPG